MPREGNNMNSAGRILLLLALIPASAPCQTGQGAVEDDGRRLIAAARLATGGPAWEHVHLLHEQMSMEKGGLDGTIESWADPTTGRYAARYTLGPDRGAEGTVIEARLDRGRGPVATVLVQRGTLKVGALVVAGSHWGRVRALIDDKGGALDAAKPSTPVEVLGFSGAPEAGDRVAVVESEARAREITEYRERQRREKLAARGPGVRTSLADMMSNLKAAGHKEMPIVLKGDVQGSVEAITSALEKLGNDEVMARVIHGGAGGITESDVTLATASKAVILGFNVRANKEARDLAEQEGVEIRYYNIIYNLVDDVKAALSGMLAPTLRETMLGNAQILELFDISKVGLVAGCRVTDGVVQRGAHVRLIRESVVVHEGKLSTLKRFKDEVAQVQAGQECGMAFENYHDMRVGDVIECYTVEEIRRTL